MEMCNCYRERSVARYKGIFGMQNYLEGYCIGTKECEECNCDGDESKCDFYPEKRKKVLTMDEYIKRDAVLKAIESVFAWNRSFGELFDEVRDIPSEDVAPVLHGRWVKHDDGVFTCSECGNAESNESYFCRYCGAKMDGGAD